MLSDQEKIAEEGSSLKRRERRSKRLHDSSTALSPPQSSQAIESSLDLSWLDDGLDEMEEVVCHLPLLL